MITHEAIASILPQEQAATLVQYGEDTLTIPIDRPPNLHGNQLGLTPIDLRELHPLHALIVERGQMVEIDRGNAGFDPNTIHFLWQPEGLSLDGLAIIIRNYTLWNH